MVDMNETTKAREVAENLVWRLEVLQHRCRYNLKTGTYKQLPTRIRRFANARPTDLVAAVIDELVKMAPYKGVVFCGEDDSDLSYRPTTTSIRKDDSLKTGSKDATYTIIQDLLLEGEADSYFGTDGSSCSQLTTVEYYWDEADVIPCPGAEQGVVYQVADVSRDKETDLFSFKVRKVQAVTQHVAEHVVECSDDSQKTVETWDNVYGEPGAYKFDSVIHGGEAISLPAPCESGQGTLVQVEVAENPDCTFKVAVTRVTSKVDDAEFLRYRDQFQTKVSDLLKNQPERLSKDGVEYGSGVKTTYESSTNPDGTFNNRVTKETERPVSAAVVTTKKTLRGTVKTVLNRNQKNAGVTSGLSIGEEVRSEKTPGGLYDVTKTTVSTTSVGTIAQGCQRTVFEHVDEKTVNQSSTPTAEVKAASGGVSYSRSARRTEEGTWDVTDRTANEIEVSGAATSVHVGLTGTTSKTVNRNAASAASTAGLKVGESVENVKTDGGRWTQTIVRVVRGAAMKVLTACQKTIFEHSHSTATVQGSDPGLTDVSEAANGVVQKRTVRLTEDGSYRVEDDTVTETPVSAAVVETRKTVGGVVTTTTDRNQPAALSGAGLKVGESVQSEKTPGGLYNNRRTSVSPTRATLQTGCEASGGVIHTDFAVVNGTSPVSASHAASHNVVRRTSARLNDNGLYDNEIRTTTYQPVTQSVTSGSTNAKTTVTAMVNAVSLPSASVATNVEESVSLSLNDHGSMTVNKTQTVYTPAVAQSQVKWATETATTTTTRHNTAKTVNVSGEYGETSASPDDNDAATTSTTTYSPIPVDSGPITWRSKNKTSTGIYTYKHTLRVFRNQPTVPQPQDGGNCSLNISINKFGRYDGSWSTSELESWEEKSSGSGSVGGIQTGTVTYYMVRLGADGRIQRLTVSVPVRTYYGPGHEGSKAQAKANATIIAGLTLPEGTYATGAPRFGSWQIV